MRTAYPPVPNATRIDKAFPGAGDPEGAHPRPPGYHAAWDIFAPAGTPIYAARSGTVVESNRTDDISGQVFGGTLKIKDFEDGFSFQYRHVVPSVGVGARVDIGDPVGTISRWLDWPGGTHCHFEVKKAPHLAHHIGNFLDPGSFEWTTEGHQIGYYFEDIPWNAGGWGPVVVGSNSGYANLATAVAAHLRIKAANPDLLIQRIMAEDGRRYLLGFKPDTTYGARYRFGPWRSEADRDRVLSQFPRRARKFNGRQRSLYPWLENE